MKSHLPFDLRLSKKLVIAIRKFFEFTWNLMIWLKRLIFTIWLSKEMVAHFQGLFLEKWILWKSSILKRFIFFSFLNMAIWHASRPTVINPKIWGRCSWKEGSGFSILEGVEDFINASGAIWSLPLHFSVCSAHEFLFFFASTLDRPFEFSP